MAITPSAIYQSTTGPQLYYKKQGATDYTQIANPNELQTLAKQGMVQVGQPYQKYTPPSANAPAPTPSATPTGTVAPSTTTPAPTATVTPTTTPSDVTGPMESEPGVFKASAVKDYFSGLDYYNRQLAQQQQGYEQAQKSLADVSTQLGNLQAPNYEQLYQQKYQTTVAPIDQQIQQVSGRIAGLDDSLRNIDDAVRQEIGGRAPESIIQAEVARRARPLELQRQGLTQQLQIATGQKQSALEEAQRSVGFGQQQFEEQRQMLGLKRDLAKDVVGQFNQLLQQGENASKSQRDDFRQTLGMFLQTSPEALRGATPEEMQQIQRGVVPTSFINKIGSTIQEQRLAAQKQQNDILNEQRASRLAAEQEAKAAHRQIIGSAESGYYSYDATTGKTVQIIAPKAPGSSVSESDIRQLANSIYERNPSLDYTVAYQQAKGMLLGGPMPETGQYGAPGQQPQQQPRISFDQYLNQEEQKQARSLGVAERQKLKQEYDALQAIQPAQEQQVNPYMSQFGRRKDDKYSAQADKMSDNFRSEQPVKDFIIQKSAYQKASNINVNTTNPQEDIALIFSFMKVLDPTSVVRESEFNSAQNANSFLDKLGIKVGQVQTGQILNAKARQNIKNVMESQFQRSQENYQDIVKTYEGRAKGQRLDPADVITDYSLRTPSGSGTNADVNGYINNLYGSPPQQGFRQGLGAPENRPTESQPTFQQFLNQMEEQQGRSIGTAERNRLQQSFNTMYGGNKLASASVSEGTPSGNLSAKYESSGSPASISWDSTGGWSYGTYQLAHNNALAFVQQSPYAGFFRGIPFNSDAFRAKWKQVAANDPQGFASAQHDYISKTHYEPMANALASRGYDVNQFSPAVREAVWSTAVQHGPGDDSVLVAMKRVFPRGVPTQIAQADEERLLKAIYNERWGGGGNFAGSTAGVRQGVYNRFFGQGGELANALRLSRQYA